MTPTLAAQQQLTAVSALMASRPLYAWHWHQSVALAMVGAEVDQ